MGEGGDEGKTTSGCQCCRKEKESRRALESHGPSVSTSQRYFEGPETCILYQRIYCLLYAYP